MCIRDRSHQLRVKLPYTVEPGSLGGVLSNMAVADGSVYVATIDLPITYTSLRAVVGDKAGSETGEVEALSLATGKVEWDTKVPSMPLGAATVSNDLILTTLYKGVLVALDRDTGAIVYQQMCIRDRRVNAISPGVTFESTSRVAEIAGPMMETTPLGHVVAPDAVARAAVFLASDDAGDIHGTVLDVDGGRSSVLFAAR